MSHKFLFNASVHSLLISIDKELAKVEQEKGCSNCGGRLDHADYPRSPMGVPVQFRGSYEERISFCCADCRRRTTPPSVRFFGRFWFPAPLLILISALTLGINERRLAQVRLHFGITVSESTWKRWRRWWRTSFMATPFWQHIKGLFPPILSTNGPLPRELFSLFTGTLEEKFYFLLKLLAPLTGGVLRAV